MGRIGEIYAPIRFYNEVVGAVESFPVVMGKEILGTAIRPMLRNTAGGMFGCN